MGVSVAEYLGQRVDAEKNIIPLPTEKKQEVPCPFRNHHCEKAYKGLKPVCSVKSESGHLWIVCSHRLCSTQPKHSPLNDHQKNMLRMVGKAIYNPTILDNEILVKREVGIKVTEDSDYSADYVMWRRNPIQNSPFNPDRAAIVEMQGGGETTNTGVITELVEKWEHAPVPTNQMLLSPTKASPLVTNAWRRQQEQFLVKGNVAMMTGGRMVFCVGSMIYDYLIQRFTSVNLVDLRSANWTLALLTFMEDTDNVSPPDCAPDSIQLKLDPSKMLYTNYSSFVQALTNQASPSTSVFTGKYTDLDGGEINI